MGNVPLNYFQFLSLAETARKVVIAFTGDKTKAGELQDQAIARYKRKEYAAAENMLRAAIREHRASVIDGGRYLVCLSTGLALVRLCGEFDGRWRSGWRAVNLKTGREVIVGLGQFRGVFDDQPHDIQAVWLRVWGTPKARAPRRRKARRIV